jgi:uncharacterized protein (TIGR03084 family)
MEEMLTDLNEEYEALDDVVTGLSETDWRRATPFLDWSVQEEISHLAFFDAMGRLAATDEAAFAEHVQDVIRHYQTFNSRERGLAMPVAELLAWWRNERRALLEAMAPLEPKARLPWYGPPMSARSFATARLMETWAHGQDVADALGLRRPVAPRIRHIAHLGVVTFGWSHAVRQKPVPDQSVRVELTGPGGENWAWGPAEAADRVSGTAEDFCLVVTQRRHVDDTWLATQGEVARNWMLLAQCFAGPPATGPGKNTFKRME